MQYKKVIASNGRTLYFVNGKMKSPKVLPNDVMVRFNEGETEFQMIDHDNVFGANLEEPSKAPARECVVCGGDGDRQKFLNMQLVYLCVEDYIHRTTGEIAEAMKEKGLI